MSLKLPLELVTRMKALSLEEEDLRETTMRARGKGGQNVNKVETCVRLEHLRTGIAVRCELFRTQLQNRMKARELLCEKMEHERDRLLQQAKHAGHTKRIQNKKRSRGEKERVLREKKARGQVKLNRRKL